MLATLVLLADLTAAAPPAPSTTPPPSWIRQCVAALERAGDQYAKLRGQRIVITVTRGSGTPGPCTIVSDEVRFELPRAPGAEEAMYWGAMIRGSEEHGVWPWNESQFEGRVSQDRSDGGRDAFVAAANYLAPDWPLFAKVFRAPLDACFAAAPPIVTTPYLPHSIASATEARARCARDAPDAPRKACELAEYNGLIAEHSCDFTRDGIFGGPAGDQPAMLRGINAAGAAIGEAILLRLSRSTNPTTRAIAAMGLSQFHDERARSALEPLRHDDATTVDRTGGKNIVRRVSSFAK